MTSRLLAPLVACLVSGAAGAIVGYGFGRGAPPAGEPAATEVRLGVHVGPGGIGVGLKVFDRCVPDAVDDGGLIAVVDGRDERAMSMAVTLTVAGERA